jgi:hypothetical protein
VTAKKLPAIIIEVDSRLLRAQTTTLSLFPFVKQFYFKLNSIDGQHK